MPEPNLLVICQDLHTSFSGSFDDWTHEEIERAIATVRHRVENWRPATGRWAAFDGAVYAVCCATLAEAEEWRRVFGRPTSVCKPEAVAPAAADRTGKTLRRVVATSDARPWEEEATDQENGLGLHVRRHANNAHIQFIQDGKVLADWWPSKGTTMMDGRRGPICATGEDVVAWLKSV